MPAVVEQDAAPAAVPDVVPPEVPPVPLPDVLLLDVLSLERGCRSRRCCSRCCCSTCRRRTTSWPSDEVFPEPLDESESAEELDWWPERDRPSAPSSEREPLDGRVELVVDQSVPAEGSAVDGATGEIVAEATVPDWSGVDVPGVAVSDVEVSGVAASAVAAPVAVAPPGVPEPPAEAAATFAVASGAAEPVVTPAGTGVAVAEPVKEAPATDDEAARCTSSPCTSSCVADTGPMNRPAPVAIGAAVEPVRTGLVAELCAGRAVEAVRGGGRGDPLRQEKGPARQECHRERSPPALSEHHCWSPRRS